MQEGETVSGKISVDGLADAIMEQLDEYKDLAVDDMKKAVKSAGKTVKQEIAQMNDISPNDVTLFVFEIYIKTPDYKRE